MILKNLFSFCLFLSFSAMFSQGVKLSKTETDKLFTPEIKTQLGIEYPVFRAYSYTDKNGKFYVALSEKFDGTKEKDTLHYKIKAVNVKQGTDALEKQWEVNDFTTIINGTDEMEESIWFWTKYCSFEDIDKDGITDPILVYGTNGYNGYDDGRIKILIFYKGEKIALRHQNGILDNERNTQVDAKFYALPLAIQNRVKAEMKKIMTNDHGIFPYGWENNMKKQKTKFSETY